MAATWGTGPEEEGEGRVWDKQTRPTREPLVLTRLWLEETPQPLESTPTCPPP